MAIEIPPRSDEFEVSLFGPGIGECVVAHIGNGEWLILDSCIDKTSGQPAALVYLDRIGVDVTSAVKTFLVTHWHDDHMRGAAAILERSTAADFCCSVALRGDEFLTVVGQNKGSLVQSSGLYELDRVFEILMARRPQGVQRTSVGPKWVQHDQRLYMRAPTSVPATEIWSLSPSGASITRALHEFGEMIASESETKTLAPRQKANDVSVAVWVEFGPYRALLGADLQADTGPARGWSAVLSSQARPQTSSAIFKIPHHGSPNAHHPEVWRQMLDEQPVAILTPYASGKTPRPAQSDIERIKSRSQRSYCTAKAGGWSPIRRGQPVDRTASMHEIRAVEAKETGHIRIRRTVAENDYRVELFHGAFSLA